ncbi:MAG TPA: bifunctional diaminohydroxyphosphoribosylaminopyrimidine deaminase/5-amino-6-(5-phosphoribosylamino)uracil reductase RibD, partial [Alphaproteobacteria bacterium]|nr:bifunctional diaminohydroxyphosphoribosylaminopyrimidine deaminase/5-amino-6-(5-phosphoribosylamino)uracil reductase RibD [Alphaproteobacteria bacterium]
MTQNPMSLAAAEARKYLGATSPNPPVGAAAIDDQGNILAVAAHKKAGGDHAEATLIKMCRDQNLLQRVHTLYVTLEPCNHHGRTPPCSDAIIEADIKRVVIGTVDPNPKVTGGGADRLIKAGVEVSFTDDDESRQLIHAFAYNVTTGRPWVTVKRAFNSKGSMIPPAGQKTFTSPSALTLAHQLRKKSDAILTGSGTVLEDNPLFTVRHVQDYPGKRRWLGILDRRKRVPQSYIDAARDRGLDAIIYGDIREALEDLKHKGAQDILVEGGPKTSEAVLDYPFWTMSVTIQTAGTESVDVQFNPNETLPFD